MTLAEEIASRYGVPVAEVERYEGVLATLAERRERLSKRWARKIKPVPRTIAKSFPTATVVSAAAAQFHASGIGPFSASSDDMGAETPRSALYTLRRDTAKALALLWLRSWLRANPDTEKDWTELVSLAEAEAAAEGVTQATALLADSGRLDVPVDLDQLYRDTLAQLRTLDSYGSEAPEWITDQLLGLAGDMGRVIADGIAHNFGSEELVKAVNEVIDKGAGAQGYIDEAINTAMMRAQLAQLVSAGVEMFDYIAMPGACDICEPLEGTYSLSDLPGCPQHFNCFPAGTLVITPRVLGSTARWYSGEVVEILTAAGNEVTVTPNHPVLTPQGWVAAGLLHEGDNLVRCLGRDAIEDRTPYHYHGPAFIENVAKTLSGTCGVSAITVPTTSEDFHGDGVGSQVHVVWADGELRDRVDPSVPKPSSKELLARAHTDTERALSSESTETLLLEGVDPSSGSVVGGLRPQGSLLRRPIRLHEPVGSGVVSNDDAPLGESSSHGIAGDPELVSQLFDGLAGAVVLDPIVAVRRLPFSGHVYNLHTETGWYIASGILVHNCRCSIAPAGTI